jgi:hypothetical protein
MSLALFAADGFKQVNVTVKKLIQSAATRRWPLEP